MPVSPDPLAALEARRAALKQALHAHEQSLREGFTALVAPPTPTSQFALWVNRAQAAYNLYDGIATGYKLARHFAARLHKKR